MYNKIPVIKLKTYNDAISLLENNKSQDDDFIIFSFFEPQLAIANFRFPYNGISAGFDLRANKTVRIHRKEKVLIPTGVKWIAPIGYYLSIVPRSGISLHTPLIIPNAPATIEGSYTGEICLMMQASDELWDRFDNYGEEIKMVKQKTSKNEFIRVKIYTKLAQCIIRNTIFRMRNIQYVYYSLNKDIYREWTDILTKYGRTQRGESGFGSTGI